LCPCLLIFEIGATIFDGVDLAVTGFRYLRGDASGGDLALTASGAAVGVVAFGGGAGRAARLAANRAKGLAAEAAVRGAFDIGGKANIIVNGRRRIPDGLTDDVLSEVKNVTGRLSYTAQLRDFADFAQNLGLRFDLYVPKGTRLSRPLRAAIDEGIINLKNIPNN